MAILIIAEHNNQSLKSETHKVVQAATAIGGDITLLVAGANCQAVADEAATIAGVNKVLLADNAVYQHQLAENVAKLVAELGADYSHILAAATTTGKNFLPRVAAMLDVAQISDVIAIESADTFVRPIYAGNAIATVQSADRIKVLTVRPAAFRAAPAGNSAPVEAITASHDAGVSTFISEELTKSERPELTAARVVISGGRGMQNGENFALLNGIADKLGATNAFAFDIMAACSGFLYSVATAAKYIESGQYTKVLVIGADKMSSIVDYSDRNTCIIFGDGAGAVLLEPDNEGYGVQDEYLRSNGSNRDLLRIEAGGSQTPTTKQTVEDKKHFIYQDGKNVFKHAVSNMSDASEQIMKRNNLTHLDVNYLVAHQANKRIIDATSNRMGIKDKKVLMNIHRYGNTTAATIPLLLFDFESKFKKGDNIIFASFGAGFTWGAMYLKWAYNH